MQKSKFGKCIYIVLSFIVMLSLFSGCSNHKSVKKVPKDYNKLLESYDKDNEYKNNTDALQDHSSNASPIKPAIANKKPVYAKYAGVFNNTGKLQNIPIPTYHCIDNAVWGYKNMFVSPGTFDEQMKYLKDQGYSTITFSDLDRINTIKKPILITFDDGYEDNYTNAYPILKKYGFKATIFLICDAIGKPKYLKLSQIRQMKDCIDFQSHTITHPHLANLSPNKIEFELSHSKNQLETLLNKKIDVIAYPYGSYNATVVNIAKKYYTYALTTHFGKFYDSIGNDYQIKRMEILDKTNFPEFVQLFK